MRTGLAVMRLGSLRDAATAPADPLTTARIYDTQWNFPSLRALCADALARDPSTAADWHLRLFGSKAVSFMTADPRPALAAIAAARESGEATVVAAALAHETQLLAVRGNWLVPLPDEPTWERMRELTERAASAYEALGDADTALELMARLAVYARGTEDRPRLLDWCEGRAAELARAGDVLAAAYCLTAAACIRIEIELGAEQAAREAFAMARAAGAPLLNAEVLLAIAHCRNPGSPPQSFLIEAAKLFAAHDHCRGIYDAQFALGVAWRFANHDVNALFAFEQAAQAAERSGIPQAIVMAHLQHTGLLFRLGQTGRALAELEETRTRIALGGHYRVMLLMQLGSFALRLRDLERARRSFMEVVRILESIGGSRSEMARAVTGIGHAHAGTAGVGPLLLALRAYKRAAAIDPSVETLAEVATACARLARWYALSRRPRPAWLRRRADAALSEGLALARTAEERRDLHLAASWLEYHFGARDAALKEVDEAVAIAASLPLQARLEPWHASVMQRIEYGAICGDLEMLERADADADAMLQALSETDRSDLATAGGAFHDSAKANAFLACMVRAPEAQARALAKARARITRAMELYEQSNERLRAGSAAETLAPQLGHHGLAAIPYGLAVRIFVDYDNSAAFEALERLKATVLASALASIRVPAPDGVPPELIEEERRLLAIGRNDPDRRERASADARLGQLWQTIARLPGGDRYARLRRGATIGWPEASLLWIHIQRELGPDRRFVILEYALLNETLIDDCSIFAFCLHGQGPGPEVVALNVGRRAVEAAAAELQRDGFETPRAAEILASLAPLLDPVRSFTRPGDLLCIIPSGSLFSIPMHAIPIDGEPLLARNAVFYASSVTTLAAAVQLRRAHERTAAVLGNPKENLEGAEEEAKTVAAMLKAPLHLGGKATSAAFLDALRTKDIVHYAGHADFDERQPLHSGIELADGLLTAEQLFAAGEATATLVALSGCETGLNRVVSGDEIVGLTRALLYAGVPTLLTSLWKVDDETTLQLMTRFYDCWLEQRMPRVDALRTAALEVRARHASVGLWAAFVLVGDWR